MLLQAQESKNKQGNELSHPSLFAHNINDLDKPIVIKKGVRKYNKYLVYPIANFMSFKFFLLSHRCLL